MKLKKELYIHNQLILDEIEKDILTSAYKIIESIRSANIHSCGAEDSYLNEECKTILSCISELLDNYTNEYPNIQENTEEE